MNEQKKNIIAFFKSTPFQRVLIGMGILVIALLIFQAGVFVGVRKASFSYRGADNYYRAFGQEHRGPMDGFMRDGFPGANSSAGRVVSLALPTIVVADRDGVEKTIRITDQTIVRRDRGEVKADALQIDDFVVVIGAPNDTAEIEAKFIRLLPPPPDLPLGAFERGSSTMINNR